ncbi:MAG: polysaccharide biosynthesis/export family protein [Bacteroidetes bacterium]|nr:polysaccharide biosynthesis/export family protein [Bacteroidota bacterium]
MIKPFVRWAGLIAIMAFLASCGSTRPLQYMQGSFDTTKLSTYKIPEPVIQQGDLLSIIVYSDNPRATALYNQSVLANNTVSMSATETGATGGGIASPTSPGYLVDKNGDIRFQGLGLLHVEGLTKAQLGDTLNAKLKDTLLTNPYYNIRFLNYKITIIGDVARPAVYSIPTERVNILEALGLAGDLNITARRDNVLVIREQNGKREWGRIDLTKPDIFSSPFYQLKQNDVVYVDLTKQKAASADQTTVRNISLAATVVTTIAVIVTLIRK